MRLLNIAILKLQNQRMMFGNSLLQSYFHKEDYKKHDFLKNTIKRRMTLILSHMGHFDKILDFSYFS